MCFCLTTGECFSSSSDSTITLWPWDGQVYLFISDPDATFTGDMDTTLNGIDYYDQETGDPAPVTQQNTVVSSLGCGSCPPVSTCN